MPKINLISQVFKGAEKIENESPIKGLVTTRNSCFCVGGDRQEHTWEHPKCIYFQPLKENPQPQQLQLLPPPKESSPAKETAGSLFERETDRKSCLSLDAPMTREMEILCLAFNRTVRGNTRDYLEMTDRDCMTISFARYMIRELHLMGHVLMEEESPFE